MPPLAPGQRFGPYETISPIGAGAMGEVWKARDTRLDRLVAIKYAQAQFSERFERESRAVAALNHPNICQLYDVGENYIVMELIEGAPLAPPDSVRKLLDIAVQISAGLAAAHSKGIVHRDLKPENILIARDGRVKILDFGLAKQGSAPKAGVEATQTIAITNPGTVLGTIAYMSPEQARGEELDARSDQFSLGLILYELAARRRAFQGPSPAETMAAIIREEPAPLPGHIPAPLRWTLERCLAKDPEGRYDSTADLHREFLTIRDRLSEASLTAAPAAAAHRPRRLNWLPYTAGTLAVVTLALAWLLARIPWRPDTSSYRFTPFAAEPYNESQPAWSPDGRSIAYVMTSGGKQALTVKGLDGSVPVVLVQAPLIHGAPGWSADGNRLYYVDRAAPSRVWTVSRAGGTPRPLSLDKVTSAAISPDGQKLAMLRVYEEQGRHIRRLWIASPPEAEAKMVAGFQPPCCIEPDFVTWSTDSSQLLARIADSEQTVIWLVTPEGKSKAIQSMKGFSGLTLSWLPGNRYAVGSEPNSYGDGASQGLRLLDIETGKMMPLLASPVALGWPSVSRDGTRIAYTQGDVRFALTEIPLDGSAPHALAPSRLSQHSITWSPNGTEYAFVRENEVIIRSRDGSNERKLVSRRDFPAARGIFEIASLDFSPDGRRIAYTCVGCGEKMGIWSSPVGGGSPAAITQEGEEAFVSTWSPDGQWIAYASENAGGHLVLRKVRVGSGENPVELHIHGCIGAAWSPAGDSILCPTPDGLFLVSSDLTQKRKLGDGYESVMTWSRDGKHIFAIRSQDGKRKLGTVDPVTGAFHDIRDLADNLRFDAPIDGVRFSLSPDEKSVTASTVWPEGDIWILDGFEAPSRWWRWR